MSSYSPNEKLRLYGLRQQLPEEGDAYYFVLVHETKEKKFLQALKKTDRFDLKDFGEVIHSGFGEPPKELVKQLESSYKVEFLN